MKAAEANSVNDEIRSVSWIRDLARPYLQGFAPALEPAGPLRGYRFSRALGRGKHARVGFFAGYLLVGPGYETFEPAPPECILFAFVDPPASALHARLVTRPESLFRSTHEYISWLTHHPPRFQFSGTGSAGLARHLPVSCWPEGRREHYSRNFLIEGLAWLVRSGLVRRLAVESLENETGANRPEASRAPKPGRATAPRR